MSDKCLQPVEALREAADALDGFFAVPRKHRHNCDGSFGSPACSCGLGPLSDALTTARASLEDEPGLPPPVIKALSMIMWESWDGGDVQDYLHDHGILTVEKYDPEKHGDSEYDVDYGDDWYAFAPPSSWPAPPPGPQPDYKGALWDLRGAVHAYLLACGTSGDPAVVDELREDLTKADRTALRLLGGKGEQDD